MRPLRCRRHCCLSASTHRPSTRRHVRARRKLVANGAHLRPELSEQCLSLRHELPRCGGPSDERVEPVKLILSTLRLRLILIIRQKMKRKILSKSTLKIHGKQEKQNIRNKRVSATIYCASVQKTDGAYSQPTHCRNNTLCLRRKTALLQLNITHAQRKQKIHTASNAAGEKGSRTAGTLATAAVERTPQREGARGGAPLPWPLRAAQRVRTLLLLYAMLHQSTRCSAVPRCRTTHGGRCRLQVRLFHRREEDG